MIEATPRTETDFSAEAIVRHHDRGRPELERKFSSQVVGLLRIIQRKNRSESSEITTEGRDVGSYNSACTIARGLIGDTWAITQAKLCLETGSPVR